jgi:hypothetical protein
MKPRESGQFQRGLIAFAVMVYSVAVLADILPDTTINSVAGPRSLYKMNRSRHTVTRSRHIYSIRFETGRRHKHRSWQKKRSWLQTIPDAAIVIGYSQGTPTPNKPKPGKTPKPGPKHVPAPVPTPPTRIVEIPQQNLVVRFVNPNRQPVSGLHLLAHVQPKRGEEVVFSDLTTDEKGQVKLAKIPLPAAVNFDLQDGATAYSGDVPAGGDNSTPPAKFAEWGFADMEKAILEVRAPLGARVKAPIAFAGRLERFAGLELPEGVQPLQRSDSAVSRPDADLLAVSTRYAAAPASTTTQHVVLYEGEAPEPIVVQRNVVDLDIEAPVNSKITTAALPEQKMIVPESGHLTCRLSMAVLQEGPIPIRVSTELSGGEAEALIESYPCDPYHLNEVHSPPLNMVRLTKMNTAGGIGVMSGQDEVVRALGNLDNGKNKNLGGVIPVADGSQWWIYVTPGISVKMRPTMVKNQAVVERVRILRPGGGNAGGITVGSTLDEMRQALGKPEVENDPRKDTSDSINLPGTIDTYLDRGLRICHADGKVQWIEIARPTPLLQQGTTAFVPRERANLFIESFTGDPRTNLNTVSDLKRYLTQVRSVRLVNSAAEADLVLSARVVDFKADKDDFTSLIPYRYDCTTQLAYSLFDTDQNRFLFQNKPVEATATVNYKKEILGGSILTLLLAKFGGDLGKVLATFVGAGGIYELRKSIQKAVNRCPAISARSVFNTMVGDINNAANFSVRVTGIDYQRGTLQLNAGTTAGVRPGDEFQVSVGAAPPAYKETGPDADSKFPPMVSVPLAYKETGLSADYYTAVVTSTDQDNATCELRHIHRKVNKSKESFEGTPAPDVLRHIPEPTSGLVSARAWVQFPSITVISDADLQKAEEYDREHEQQSANNASNLANQSTTPAGDKGSANTIDKVFDKIFKKKGE